MFKPKNEAGRSVEFMPQCAIGAAVFEGSFTYGIGWLKNLEGSNSVQVELSRTLGSDVIVGFGSSDVDNPDELGGELEVWLEDEKYITTESSFIYIPAEIKDCSISKGYCVVDQNYTTEEAVDMNGIAFDRRKYRRPQLIVVCVRKYTVGQTDTTYCYTNNRCLVHK